MSEYSLIIVGQVDMVEKRIRKTRVSGVERRKAIVSAAVRLFSQQGFANTTTREIAANAGVAEGTIYRYFSSKQDILFAFIEPTALHDFAAHFPLDNNIDDLSLISAFILNRMQILQANQHLIRVVIGEALHNPVLIEGLRAMILPAISSLEAYFVRRINAGVFRKVDAELASRALFGHIMGYFIQSILFPVAHTEINMEQIASELARLYLQGMMVIPIQGGE